MCVLSAWLARVLLLFIHLHPQVSTGEHRAQGTGKSMLKTPKPLPKVLLLLSREGEPFPGPVWPCVTQSPSLFPYPDGAPAEVCGG